MGKRNRKNNGRNSDTIALELYNLIIDDDEIRDIANKFCDEDELLDFVEDAWGDEEDSYIDLVEDILNDNSMIRGFSPRRFLPAMLEWLKDEFKYNNGDLGLILNDIGTLCGNASKDTLEAYAGITIIYKNIVNDYELESSGDIGAIATIHAIRATLNHIKKIGDNESYMAASSSTEEPEKPEKSKEKTSKKEEKKPEEKESSNASKVDEEELKDKIDIESMAQNIYSEIKGSGKLEEMIMNGIIEGLRQVVDSGKMTSDTEEEIVDKVNKSTNESDLINDAIKTVIDSVTTAMGGDAKSFENVINRLRAKNDKDIIDVEENELKEVTDVVPVGEVVDKSDEIDKVNDSEDDFRTMNHTVFGRMIKLKYNN